MIRLRVQYQIGPGLKFLANLDMMRLMERALRRADIPYALSEGYNPHIRMSLGTVLPVGLWGLGEYFDLELRDPMAPDTVREKLNRVLPGEISVIRCVFIPPDAPSLMRVMNAASYVFVLDKGVADIQGMAQQLLSSGRLVVASRGKKKDLPKDLRPGIYEIRVMTQDRFDMIEIWVSTGEPLNVRFDELRDLLVGQGVPPSGILDIYRSGNYCMQEGKFYSPLEKVK